MTRRLLLLTLFAAAVAPAARAQQPVASRAWATNVIVPQGRAIRSAGGASPIAITDVTADIRILEQVATTTLDIGLRNGADRREEAELLVPVPAGVTVRGFTFQGSAPEAAAKLLPAYEARRIYAAIVAKLQDPGLLQFAGHDMLRSSVFPIDAGGTQRVRIVWEQVLLADGPRLDYVLPRTEFLGYKVPWKIEVSVRSRRPVATVYSPSHPLEIRRASANVYTARVPDRGARDPGPFQLSVLRAGDGVTASLFAYPEAGTDGGTFLLLAGLPGPDATGRVVPAIRREVTLVIDRSGSMKGGKLDQVREAAKQILAGLADGERFNLFSYNETIDSFSPGPVEKSAEAVKAADAYLDGLTPQGGTNLHDALAEALRQKPSPSYLPLVLFLTDGLPTVGVRSESAIRDVAVKANPHQRRVFTIGVGVDVNTPLLDRVATSTRAKATFILPREDIEVKVGQVFRRLQGPILASPALRAVASEGAPRIQEVYPRALEDMFEGDQLVVLGRYVGEAPLDLELAGNFRGERRTFRFRFDLTKATARNAFVPRLWASRKIAYLIDEIRASGADLDGSADPAATATDPRFKELVDEIVRLSLRHGILTEYTAYLAEVGTDLAADAVGDKAAANLDGRARWSRSGQGSVNQELNNGSQRGQVCVNRRNGFLDERMQRVDVYAVQQMGDRTFFFRNVKLTGSDLQIWVDSRLLDRLDALGTIRKIRRGGSEHGALALHLAKNGRQGCLALHSILTVVDGKVVLVEPASRW